ncbi:hypothetical protein [Mycolicibacter heraklionensis]|uniref:hypothetical protein n=1 Tax=Mycolicibacter heraklionensis TaxID=512402 RepID=UPI0007EA27F1|nr:hypothetical protein [Mycolicibacter heraklionensis]OBG32448.1 hypothetical protein A5671_07820 [Mycolicibacter heraklionensis]
MTTPITKVGDVVHLLNFITSNSLFGVVCDEDTPQQMSMTMEVVGGEAVITTPVLQGRKGDKGDNAPIVQLHFIAGLRTFEDALTKLPNWDASMKNHGVWLVDDEDNPTKSLVYVWDGTEWHQVLPGPAGPPGVTPNISMEFETIPMSERESNPDVEETVEVSGDVRNPHFKIRALSPQGEPGPAAAIGSALDYDGSGGKSIGDALTVLENGKWGPSKAALKLPRLYSIPEGAFTNTPNFIGIGPTTFQVGSYVIEAQPYAWKPKVMGKLRVGGIELDENPLRIGCEVRIQTAGGVGDGQLIGRAEGDNGTLALIFPHYSTPSDVNKAIAPGNGVCVIPALVQTTITISLVNQGLASWYSFNRTDAQVTLEVWAEE